MNLETDLKVRMNINRQRRIQGDTKRLQARSSMRAAVDQAPSVHTDKGEEVFPVDLVQIEISDLTFSYPNMHPVFTNVKVNFDQGGLYAFVGPAHQGKSTLLKLLGLVLLP